MAAGCVRTGDLGRPSASAVRAESPLYRSAATEPLERSLPLTDLERELRDRAWAFVDPQNAGPPPPWQALLAALDRTGEAGRDNRVGYGDALLGRPFASSGARYARLVEDIEADDVRFGPLLDVARRVAAADRARAGAMAAFLAPAAEERRLGAARINENRQLVLAVRRALLVRAAAYRATLERLVVVTPDRAAVEAERSLVRFERNIRDAYSAG
jgi:hypothetical protein